MIILYLLLRCFFVEKSVSNISKEFLKQINYAVENVRNLNEDDHLLHIFMEFRHCRLWQGHEPLKGKNQCSVQC